MNAPVTIIIRNAKFSFVKSFTTANAPDGCTAQAEYAGQRGRSVFVQFFGNGTVRAIGGGKVHPVTI